MGRRARDATSRAHKNLQLGIAVGCGERTPDYPLPNSPDLFGSEGRHSALVDEGVPRQIACFRFFIGTPFICEPTVAPAFPGLVGRDREGRNSRQGHQPPHGESHPWQSHARPSRPSIAEPARNPMPIRIRAKDCSPVQVRWGGPNLGLSSGI